MKQAKTNNQKQLDKQPGWLSSIDETQLCMYKACLCKVPHWRNVYHLGAGSSSKKKKKTNTRFFRKEITEINTPKKKSLDTKSEHKKSACESWELQHHTINVDIFK